MAVYTLEAFVSTKAAPSDALWEALQEGADATDVPRDACHMYAERHLIHEDQEQFWVHAWWYAPRPYATLSEAEEALYKWYLEFAE